MITSGVRSWAMASSRSASIPFLSPSMIRCSSRRSTDQSDRSSPEDAVDAVAPSKRASSSVNGS